MIFGLLVAVTVVMIMRASEQSPAAAWTAGITTLCAIWWMTEAIPLAATALIPIAIFPLLGILTPSQTAEAYGNSLILLFLGGFLLSKAMECSGAHRRLAIALVNLLGSSERRLVFGFMLASAALSMWVSNTATVLMLLPVAVAVLQQSQSSKLAVALLLGVAYGASVGGLGTPIGSPPNLIFLKVYQESTGEQMSFLSWMAIGFPVLVLLLPIMGLWLTRGLNDQAKALELPSVGRWRSDERRVLLIFTLTAMAWITRSDPFGGWSHWANLPAADDASVALLAALLLFVVPNGRGGRLLNWEAAQTIPWGMLVLFAGGIAIAKAFVSSGLSDSLGALLAGATALPLLGLMLLISFSVIFLTEINSNTASAVLVMPILAAIAIAAQIDPRLLMVPATMSASCAFMLPVATPPNAIVFGSGRVPSQAMLREGFVLNVVASLLICSVCYCLLR